MLAKSGGLSRLQSQAPAPAAKGGQPGRKGGNTPTEHLLQKRGKSIM
jgi:hypothetical protein